MQFRNLNKQNSTLFSVFLHGVIILSVILFYYINEEKTLLTAKQKQRSIKAELVSIKELKVRSLPSKPRVIKAPKKITTPKKRVPKKPKPKIKKDKKVASLKKKDKALPSKKKPKQKVASKSEQPSKIKKDKKVDTTVSSKKGGGEVDNTASSENLNEKVANNSKTTDLSDYAQEQLNYYNKSIYHTLISSWIRPPGIALGERFVSKVLINLAIDGTILKVTIIKSSGNKIFDRYVRAAILKVRKFDIPQDPVLFAEFYENLYIDFTNPKA